MSALARLPTQPTAMAVGIAAMAVGEVRRVVLNAGSEIGLHEQSGGKPRGSDLQHNRNYGRNRNNHHNHT
eukprot:174455-Hanusia_phi.AAC.1